MILMLRAGAQEARGRVTVGICRLCSKFGRGGAREPLGYAEGYYVVVSTVSEGS